MTIWRSGPFYTLLNTGPLTPNTGHVIPIALGMTGIDQMEVRIMSLVGQR